jgi:hypothetical protein
MRPADAIAHLDQQWRQRRSLRYHIEQWRAREP